jgi:hypothetical protein
VGRDGENFAAQPESIVPHIDNMAHAIVPFFQALVFNKRK